MNNRRALLSTSILAASAAALAACAATGTTTTATVEQIIADIQAALPWVEMLATGISIAVPASASIMPTVEAGLTAASGVFATITSTMTAAQAQPLVGQITTSLSGAVKAIQGVVAGAPAGSALAQFAAPLAQAQAVIALLTTFANGVTSGAAPMMTAAKVVPDKLFIRTVR